MLIIKGFDNQDQKINYQINQYPKKNLIVNLVPDVVSTVTVSPDTPNVFQSMIQVGQDKTRVESTNKVALEEEKEKDVTMGRS